MDYIRYRHAVIGMFGSIAIGALVYVVLAVAIARVVS